MDNSNKIVTLKYNFDPSVDLESMLHGHGNIEIDTTRGYVTDS